MLYKKSNSIITWANITLKVPYSRSLYYYLSSCTSAENPWMVHYPRVNLAHCLQPSAKKQWSAVSCWHRGLVGPAICLEEDKASRLQYRQNDWWYCRKPNRGIQWLSLCDITKWELLFLRCRACWTHKGRPFLPLRPQYLHTEAVVGKRWWQYGTYWNQISLLSVLFRLSCRKKTN